MTDQNGNIVFISTPYVGSVHDLTALRDARMLNVLAPEHVTADQGYLG
ncbi:transposase family protein [Corynebacterium durum]